PFQAHLNAASLGYAYALIGRVADGLPLLEDAVEQVTRTGGLFSQSLLLGWFGEAYLLAGRIDDALATASRALDLCRARSEQGREAYVPRLLGEVAGARKPADVQTGEDRYRQAIELARQHGMQPVVAHCPLGLSKLYRRTGKREQAQEHLTAATTMFREMGMTSWLEKAEAEMKAARKNHQPPRRRTYEDRGLYVQHGVHHSARRTCARRGGARLRVGLGARAHSYPEAAQEPLARRARAPEGILADPGPFCRACRCGRCDDAHWVGHG